MAIAEQAKLTGSGAEGVSPSTPILIIVCDRGEVKQVLDLAPGQTYETVNLTVFRRFKEGDTEKEERAASEWESLGDQARAFVLENHADIVGKVLAFSKKRVGGRIERMTALLKGQPVLSTGFKIPEYPPRYMGFERRDRETVGVHLAASLDHLKKLLATSRTARDAQGMVDLDSGDRYQVTVSDMEFTKVGS